MRLAVLVVGLVTLARFINLLKTPVFGDEGLYCYLGYQINHLPLLDSFNLVVNFWKDAPLLPLINAAALKLLPFAPPLWVCRAAVTVTSGVGAMTLFSLGGWWAVLFYLLNPFNFFLDRTVLMEPVLNAAMLLFMVASLWAIKHTSKIALIVTGVTTVLMLAAKQTAILALPLILVWARNKRVMLVIAVTATILVGEALKLTRLWDTAAMHATTAISLVRIKANLWLIGSWLIQYWSWGVVPVIILGWRWKWVLPLAYFILTFATIGWTLFPRYLLIVTPFVALLAGQAAKNSVGKILLMILLIIFVRRDIAILLQPDKAQLARETRYQFFEDWGSGLGTSSAINWLEQQTLSSDTLLLVPQDIQGLWVMSSLSFVPQLNLSTNFYTNDDNLLNQIEAHQNRPIFLIATVHHSQLVNLVKQKYQINRLLITHGENRNSVTIDAINL